MDNKLDFTLSEQVVNEATQLLEKLLLLLKPHFIALSPNERKTIPKMSDKTQPFVEKTIAYCDSMPQFIPPYMDVKALKNDIELYNQLIPLLRLVKQLYSGIDDTAMQAGGESYINALNYYNTVKQGSRNDIPGAKGIVADLSKRFAKNRSEELEEPKE